MNHPDITQGVWWVDCPHCEWEHEVLAGWDATEGTPFGYYTCDDENFRILRNDKTRVEEVED